jgi:hypothetical protein
MIHVLDCATGPTEIRNATLLLEISKSGDQPSKRDRNLEPHMIFTCLIVVAWTLSVTSSSSSIGSSPYKKQKAAIAYQRAPI